MLIIAIPKSASTSLLATLKKVHNLEGKQLFFKNNLISKEYIKLSSYHSDIREYTTENIRVLTGKNQFFKQHIPPTQNNIELLKGKKKVILLREPEEIISAYYRAEKKNIHDKRTDFTGTEDESAWIIRAGKIGLIKELEHFFETWENLDDEKLIIDYKDLVNDPRSTINKIESYFQLSITNKDLILAKKRYSRTSRISGFFHGVKRMIFKIVYKIFGK